MRLRYLLQVFYLLLFGHLLRLQNATNPRTKVPVNCLSPRRRVHSVCRDKHVEGRFYVPIYMFWLIGFAHIRSFREMRLELPGELLTGSVFIDEEHKKILDVINHCLEIVETKDAESKKFEDALRTLIHDVRSHFENEEQLLKDMGYDGLEKHKAHHAQSLHDLDTALDIVRSGVLPPQWIIHTVVHLFISDVMVPDTNIKNHIKISLDGVQFIGPDSTDEAARAG
ncbi:hemerythrin family protein [Magnetovibrio sp. PR-2]|uniref:bacteriohemerythrin n=1 Tax=Magnetovibrio sp. PR-2 TaxID=3120356 RepID=UPI002FCDE356